MTVYLIQHPLPAWRGVLMGVDFYDGQGSTSSPHDAVLLVKEGCTIPDPAARAEIVALAAELDRARQKRDAERKVQADFERTPAYTESALRRKAEREAAEKELKRKSRPRRRYR